MIPIRPLAVVLVCAAIGGALGYLQRSGFVQTDGNMPFATQAMQAWQPNSLTRRDNSQGSAEPSLDDPGKALLQASLHASSLHRRYAMSRLAQRLSSAELETLLRTWLADRTRDRDPMAMMEIWAEKDPKAAAQFVESEKNIRLRFALLRGWSRHDSQGAIAWVTALPSRERLQALVEVQKGDFQNAKSDPGSIIEAAILWMRAAADESDFTKGNLRNNLHSLWRGWAFQDAVAAEAMARQSGDADQQSLALRAVLSVVAESDPVRASELFARTPFPSDASQQWQAAAIAGSLAGSDLEAAKEFAGKQPAGLSQSIALTGIAQVLLKSSPEAAIAFIENIPIADSAVLIGFLGSLSERDPVAALQLAAQRMDALPSDSSVRKDLQAHFERLIRPGTAPQSEELAEFIASQAAPDRQRSLVSLVQHWAASDLAAATAWATATPPGAIRDYAITGLAEGRANANPNEASKWVQTLQGADYAAGVEGFAVGAFRKDPDGALAWLRTIPDPVERQRRLTSAWTRWAAEKDMAGWPTHAAIRWRDSSPDLTTEERKVLVFSER